MKNIFTLRNSTNADYAYKGALDFKYDFFNTALKYEVINPGFRSLGMTSTINDKQKYGAMMGFRLLNNILMINLRYDAQMIIFWSKRSLLLREIHMVLMQWCALSNLYQ